VLAFHLDFVFILAHSGKVIGKLHSQPCFGGLPKAFISQIAISGLIPDFPWMTLLSACR
jgi:hypothetical protein